jgi:hypothetical protein
MRRLLCSAWAATATLLLGGCMTGPLHENPLVFRADVPVSDNPVFLPLGPNPRVYGTLFEKVMDVITDYNFEIAYSNRYDGRIESFPVTAPGVGQPWKPGSPDLYQRFLATFQSIRHRAVVMIQPAQDGGYFIEVQVLKELEDLARPARATAASVVFRSDATVERQYEVVEAAVFEPTWIPIGRDALIEQILLERIAHIDVTNDKPTWFAPKPQ